jgi:hypothetical protein
MQHFASMRTDGYEDKYQGLLEYMKKIIFRFRKSSYKLHFRIRRKVLENIIEK